LYTKPSTSRARQFPRAFDTIFFYSKTDEQNTFNSDVVRVPYSKKTKANYKTGLKGSGTLYHGEIKSDEGILNELGKIPPNWWEIAVCGRYPRGSSNNIGYPTQKPEALLDRIIRASSNENDIVLDPFMGGGTTIAVADRLKRKWIGIDQSVQAVRVTEMRLQKQQDLFSSPFAVKLHKYDYDTLRYKDAFQFESWIVSQYGGTPNVKQRSDWGTDGRTKDGIPIQVKRSDGVGHNVVDNFRSACERFDKALFERNKQESKPVGVLIAFSFGRGAIEEVSRLQVEQSVIISLVKVEDIVPIAKKPKVSIAFKDIGLTEDLREIEFTATCETPVQLFAWDWAYDAEKKSFKPSVLLDKTGVQRNKFKPGEYIIAVRVIDDDGLITDEVLEIKVNGGLAQLAD